MDLTVILCTYNRCRELKKALAALACQRTNPGMKWEVLLVDNNSTDKTKEVFEQLRKNFPVVLRYVYEPKQGLSHARNRGIKEALGQYLLFTDDDTEPDPYWVENMWRTFKTHSCDAVTGKIKLKFLCHRPKWLTDELVGFLAHLDYGNAECVLSTDDFPPIGANMAFSASSFGQLGGFDPTLGRCAKKLIGGEEIDMFLRFLRLGLTAIYQPSSVVYHSVDQDRLRKSYFRILHFNSGKVSGERHRVSGRHLFGIPFFIFPQIFRSISRFTTVVFKKGFAESLRKEMNIWYFLGFILGCLRAWLYHHRFAI